jgi:RNA recognition motif-containing protein
VSLEDLQQREMEDADLNRSVYITGLPLSGFSEKNLDKIMKQFGTVVRATIQRNRKGNPTGTAYV